ncbi:tyrosine-type recombinase/integrase [Sphingomonas profundi]|uniref:tyrosine-type recombinase/integrase n=1 Tax=Alterirhizorhabdus profundi TaxID=2681549 RepID=UPI0012E8990B|nr:integrase arm-type DNA-binding domain-containing protein [Sphingomonas profundi]
MLTNAAVKAARPRAAAYKLSDAGGLHLYVAPNGRRSFRMRFRWEGREQLLTFGTWPEISLDAARTRCEAAREQLARGEDPRAAARNCEIAQSANFETIARRWHAHMLPRWSEVHARDVLASLERVVFPAIGAMPIGAITPPVVLNALRLVERRGRLETARRVRQRISAVFQHAIAEGIVDSDPAGLIGRALMPPAPARRQPALVDIGEARALLAAVEHLRAAPAVALASRFLALTAVRMAAVRGARWNEIEDLDGDAPTWRVPAARMKLAAAKKKDAGNDHLVPLSAQAVQLLRGAAKNGYDTPSADALIFARGAGVPIGEAAIGALYARAGFAGRHVPHGWRATFSTILNESFPEERGAIDRALGHVGGGRDEKEEGINRKVEGAYNRALHMPRRRRLFQAWADELDGI